MASERIILNVGDKYWDWEVVEMLEFPQKGRTLCKCRCKCGNIRTHFTYRMKKGSSRCCKQCAGKESMELFHKIRSGEYILVKKEG
jgi:hypothetical protein